MSECTVCDDPAAPWAEARRDHWAHLSEGFCSMCEVQMEPVEKAPDEVTAGLCRCCGSRHALYRLEHGCLSNRQDIPPVKLSVGWPTCVHRGSESA